MTLDYFYGQSGELFSYFRIPKAHLCILSPVLLASLSMTLWLFFAPSFCTRSFVRAR